MSSLHPRGPVVTGALVLLLGAAGCVSTGRLAEYDFTDRSVAVVTTTPPRPDILTSDEIDLTGESVVGALLRIGTDAAKEYQAHHARPRLDSASTAVDVAGRLAARVLDDGTRQLRARPVGSVRDSDFEIDVRVIRYGIEADDRDSQARFFVQAEVALLERPTGRLIWNARVDEKEPLNAAVVGGGAEIDAVVTAVTLASLSRVEMERTLEQLADYCADRVVDKLRKGLEKVRG